MADLLAHSLRSNQQWQFPLPMTPIRLGRLSAKCDWSAEWDPMISGLHAWLEWDGQRLSVRRDPESRNPILWNGRIIERGEEFRLGIGEHFQIGNTTFAVVESDELPTPLSEGTVRVEDLRHIGFSDAAGRIEALVDLPRLIRNTPSDDELADCALDVVLRGTTRASKVALVWVPPEANKPPEVRRWLNRSDDCEPFRPSTRLIVEAVRRRRQPVIHVWEPGQGGSSLGGAVFTARENCDWAVCTPLPDDPEPGWALYVTGPLPRNLFRGAETAHEADLRGDLRFAKLVADLMGALRQLKALRGRQLLLERMLPPPVRRAVAGHDAGEALRARPAQVTVLFCDLRGSARIAEEEPDLAVLWNRVSQALTYMTAGISDRDGVIGDFQGDAAMGFWGWPVDQEDQAIRAARAALDIQKDFTRHALPNSPLDGFRTGIGIARGMAYAGCLGTADHMKVSVYGAVVNLAARLESLTKRFGVRILLDAATAEALQGRTEGWARLRRLARIQPYGLTGDHLVWELMGPTGERDSLDESDRLDYEAALDFFLEGRWAEARELLRGLEHDGPARLVSGFMESVGRTPEDWSQRPVIPMDAK